MKHWTESSGDGGEGSQLSDHPSITTPFLSVQWPKAYTHTRPLNWDNNSKSFVNSAIQDQQCPCSAMHGLLYIEGFRPEWHISTIYHCRDTPFWSETLEIQMHSMYISRVTDQTGVSQAWYIVEIHQSVFRSETLDIQMHSMYISRVTDQTGVSQAWYIVEIHHSGRKPSIYKCILYIYVHKWQACQRRQCLLLSVFIFNSCQETKQK